MKTYLLKKTINASIDKLPQFIKAGDTAKSYNYVKGFGIKGDFEIYSFFDDSGKMIKRIRNYNKDGRKSQSITNYRDKFNSKTVNIEDGVVRNIVKKEKRWGNSRSGFLLSETITSRGVANEKQKVMFCKAGEAPKEFSYKTCWDGNRPDIHYKNMDRIFDNMAGVEFLPTFINQSNFMRYKHIFQAELKSQELENVFDEFYVITKDQLGKMGKEIDDYNKKFGVAGIFDEKTGKTYYVIDKLADPVDTISHEVQHARDHSDLARLEDAICDSDNIAYFEKSRKRGIITPFENSDEYNRLNELRQTLQEEDYYAQCMNDKHDDLLIEKYAINRGKLQSDNLAKLVRKMFEYFGFW